MPREAVRKAAVEACEPARKMDRVEERTARSSVLAVAEAREWSQAEEHAATLLADGAASSAGAIELVLGVLPGKTLLNRIDGDRLMTPPLARGASALPRLRSRLSRAAGRSPFLRAIVSRG